MGTALATIGVIQGSYHKNSLRLTLKERIWLLSDRLMRNPHRRPEEFKKHLEESVR